MLIAGPCSCRVRGRFIRRGRYRTRPTRLAASTDSDDRVAAVTELLDALSRPPTTPTRGAALRAAVEQFGDRSALQGLPPPPIDARTARVLVFDRRSSAAARRARARRRRSSAQRSRAATARDRAGALRLAPGRGRRRVGAGRRPQRSRQARPTAAAAAAARRSGPAVAEARPAVLAACVRLIRDGAADALREFASPPRRRRTARGTLRRSPSRGCASGAAGRSSGGEASAEHFVAVVRVSPPAPREPPPPPSGRRSRSRRGPCRTLSASAGPRPPRAASSAAAEGAGVGVASAAARGGRSQAGISSSRRRASPLGSPDGRPGAPRPRPRTRTPSAWSCDSRRSRAAPLGGLWTPSSQSCE